METRIAVGKSFRSITARLVCVHRHLSYDDLREVKRLYISGNPLPPGFFPPRPLFALIYLEAAACKLSNLPSNFGHLVPNMRLLNLNYNFIEDLNELKSLRGLRKLCMVGGRLGSKGRMEMMESIRELRTLEEVDIR